MLPLLPDQPPRGERHLGFVPAGGTPLRRRVPAVRGRRRRARAVLSLPGDPTATPPPDPPSPLRSTGCRPRGVGPAGMGTGVPGQAVLEGHPAWLSLGGVSPTDPGELVTEHLRGTVPSAPRWPWGPPAGRATARLHTPSRHRRLLSGGAGVPAPVLCSPTALLPLQTAIVATSR